MTRHQAEQTTTRRRGPARAASSTVAIGVATAFIALAAVLSFVGDPPDETSRWALRGTLSPNDAGGGPAPLPAAPKRA